MEFWFMLDCVRVTWVWWSIGRTLERCHHFVFTFLYDLLCFVNAIESAYCRNANKPNVDLLFYDYLTLTALEVRHIDNHRTFIEATMTNAIITVLLTGATHAASYGAVWGCDVPQETERESHGITPLVFWRTLSRLVLISNVRVPSDLVVPWQASVKLWMIASFRKIPDSVPSG